MEWSLPITLASTLLLHFLRIGINVSILAEVAGQVLNFFSGAVGEASVVTVVLLVRASH